MINEIPRCDLVEAQMAVTKTLNGLRKKGLLNEKPAARNATAWREGEDGRRMLLVITDAGLQALDSEPAEESSKQPTPRISTEIGTSPLHCHPKPLQPKRDALAYCPLLARLGSATLSTTSSARRHLPDIGTAACRSKPHPILHWTATAQFQRIV